MTSIQLTLTGAQAKAEVDGLLTAGMVGVPVNITWDESWDGLVKTLVCKSDNCVRTVLNVGNQATVAPEVFRTEPWTPNALYLGVEGRDSDGTLVIPSTLAYCGQILPGATAEEDVSMEPENPAWAKILHLIGNMDFLVTTQKESLVGAINEAASLVSVGKDGRISVSASYQLGSSGMELPTGSWSDSVPQMVAGQYLWTKITLSQEGESPVSVYTVSGGGVATVNRYKPDSKGNVMLTTAHIGAVSVTGGTMTGPLSMVEPWADAHGATKGYVDSKHFIATATLSASGWSSSAPYTQTVTVAGVIAEDYPHVSPVYSDALATALAQKKSWEMVHKAVATADSLAFYCFEDKPTTDIPIRVEVNR